MIDIAASTDSHGLIAVGTDTETTGTEPDRDRVIEVAVVRLFADGTRQMMRWLCNPGIAIPPSATKVHGFTDAMVADQPSFAVHAAEIAAGLTVPDGAAIVGHNLRRFDLPLLAAEFARCGRPPPWQGAAIVDTLVIDRKLRAHTLAGAVRHYLGREHAGAHGALADTDACLDVLAAMRAQHPELPGDFSGLDAFGRDRHDDWATESGHIRIVDGKFVLAFGKHNGKPLKSVPRDFLRWVLTKDFPDDVKKLIREALYGNR